MDRFLLVLTLLASPIPAVAAELPAEMIPLRYLESANGLLLNHAPSPRGPFWTAFGVLGFKPSTAFDEYRLSPRLQRTFPVQNQDDFFTRFTTDPTFYTALAAQHWAKLKRLAGGDVVKAAYGWHYGQTRLLKVQAEQVRADEYAQEYARLAQPLLASN